MGAEFVATGHYARLERNDASDELRLLRGIDDSKDQSYVLFGIKRKYLQRMLLPVGSFEKPKIREIAGTLGLNVAEKKDSQEICFVTSGHHGDFVRARTEGRQTSGNIVTTDGQVVGEHPGIEGYTIGQRKGLGVAMGEPYFVVRIETDSNNVVIGRKEELGCTVLTGDDLNWLTDEMPDGSPIRPGETLKCEVQIRYNSRSCLLYTSPSPRDRQKSRMPSSA